MSIMSICKCGEVFSVMSCVDILRVFKFCVFIFFRSFTSTSTARSKPVRVNGLMKVKHELFSKILILLLKKKTSCRFPRVGDKKEETFSSFYNTNLYVNLLVFSPENYEATRI